MIGANSLGDVGSCCAAEFGCAAKVQPEAHAPDESGGERVAAPGGVDDGHLVSGDLDLFILRDNQCAAGACVTATQPAPAATKARAPSANVRAAVNPTNCSSLGKLYRLTVTSSGRPGELTTLWRSLPGELPDGLGVARSGRIYVANVGLTNQLVVLSSSGKQLERFPKVPVLGNNGSPVPFDGPSNATFRGTKVLVANQSPILGNRSHHVILEVEVGEPGAPVHLPNQSRLS